MACSLKALALHCNKYNRVALRMKSSMVIYEPHRDKTNKMACAPSKDLYQPGHPPSLIRVFAVRLKKARTLSYQLSAQQRLWSDWADAQADLSLRWAHMPFCLFYHVAAHFGFVLFALSLDFLSSFRFMVFSTPFLRHCHFACSSAIYSYASSGTWILKCLKKAFTLS